MEKLTQRWRQSGHSLQNPGTFFAIFKIGQGRPPPSPFPQLRACQGYEVPGVFLDISKAYDKVWHEGRIFKFEQNGISGKLLRLIKDFLSNRKQRVVLNGQCSSQMDVQAGVPQGSLLGPLLFLIFINDLPDNLVSNPKLFADNI